MLIKSDDKFFDDFLNLGLPIEDYAVIGSGPLIVRSLIEPTNDLDIIARGKAWDMAVKLGDVESDSFNKYKVVRLFDGKIEIYSGWAPGDWDTDKLIDEADVINGIRFVTLSETIKWKKIAGRNKDHEHIKLIQEHLDQSIHNQD